MCMCVRVCVLVCVNMAKKSAQSIDSWYAPSPPNLVHSKGICVLVLEYHKDTDMRVSVVTPGLGSGTTVLLSSVRETHFFVTLSSVLKDTASHE